MLKLCNCRISHLLFSSIIIYRWEVTDFNKELVTDFNKELVQNFNQLNRITNAYVLNDLLRE